MSSAPFAPLCGDTKALRVHLSIQRHLTEKSDGNNQQMPDEHLLHPETSTIHASSQVLFLKCC